MLKIRKPLVAPQYAKAFFRIGYIDYEPLDFYRYYGFADGYWRPVWIGPDTYENYYYYTFIIPGFESVFILLVVNPLVEARLTMTLFVDRKIFTSETTTVYPGQGEVIAFKRLFNLSPGFHEVILRLTSDVRVDEMYTKSIMGYGKLIRKYVYDTPVYGSTSFGFAYHILPSLVGTEYVQRNGIIYMDVSTVDKEVYYDISYGATYDPEFLVEELPFELEFRNNVILIEETADNLLKVEVPFKGAVSLIYSIHGDPKTLCVSPTGKHFMRYKDFPTIYNDVAVLSFQTRANFELCKRLRTI